MRKNGFEFGSIVYPFDAETAIEIWEPKFYNRYVKYINRKQLTQGTLNYNCIETLKSLEIGDFTGESRDSTDLFVSTELDTLWQNYIEIFGEEIANLFLIVID